MRLLISNCHISSITSFIRTTSKRVWLIGLLVVGLWLAGGAVAVRGQSALDGFDPNANGTVRAVVVQPDGKILIGGDFTTLSPNGGVAVTRNRIARLNPDGTLDTAFNPNANGGVFTIAVQADGRVLAGGEFFGANSIGGQTRNYIARLDATTGAADSFDPNANGIVSSIAVQANGKILAGGGFNGANSIGGQTRNFIARLDTTTGLADSFDPNATDIVRSIALQPDGKILVGGQFFGANSIGGQPRNFIARLDAATGWADSFDSNANGIVFSIAVQADGRVLVGGDFNGTKSIGGQLRNRIARLDATTGLADSFDPNANNTVYSIAVQANGKILAGGGFTNIGGETRNRIARLDAVTGLADSFDPDANNEIHSIAVQADGKILIGGDFTTLGAAVTRNRIARLEIDGSLDQTLDPGTVGLYVFTTAVQPDGKILIGGTFSTVLGVTRNNIARLNKDGTLDTAFNPNANGGVFTIAVQPDGKVLVGGNFFGPNSMGGQTRNRIARLDATTGAPDSFNPNANSVVMAIALQPDGKVLAGGLFSGLNSIGGQARNFIARLDATTGSADSLNPNAGGVVRSIAVQTDGKILVGGEFFGSSSIGGQTRNRIARLDATTGAADSFNPNANGIVFSIGLQADGRVLVGGAFNGANSIGGQPRNRIARLDATTGLADSFDPNANNIVYSIAVQADGRVIAGGDFFGASSIGGQTRNRIARLDATTGEADSFDPNANNSVYSIASQPDGKILAGGQFTGANSIGGQTRNLFARLTNDIAALQNVAVTQATITWTLSGSSPQVTRVSFEQSIDNGATYTFLGNGTPSFGAPLSETTKDGARQIVSIPPLVTTYTLTGLNLPIRQNVLIRARGFYRSGLHNDSESTMESVRNAYFAQAAGATVSVSGRVLTPRGGGLASARVILTDSNGNSRMAITSPFGYYRFETVSVSETYVFSISSKRYQFAPQVVYVSDQLNELNFFPEF